MAISMPMGSLSDLYNRTIERVREMDAFIKYVGELPEIPAKLPSPFVDVDVVIEEFNRIIRKARALKEPL